MILILASPQDVHARCVKAVLERTGHQVRIIDSGELGNGALLSYPIGGNPETISVSGEAVRFDAVRCVWYRRPRLGHVAEAVKNPAIRQFCRQEWANLLDGLFLNSPARFVNPLLSEFGAVKPRQLHIASMVGLATPDTLITNDPEKAGLFIGKYNGNVIHKALTAPNDRLIDTKRWDETDRPALETLRLAPTIFQELIRGPADVRATVVGSEIFAAKISTAEGRAGVDSRMDMDALYEQHRLPTEIRDRLLAFMDRMGLVYGTIDLKITDGGEYVFLEVNPQGQFLYVEILTGMPITEAMAALLAQQSGTTFNS